MKKTVFIGLFVILQTFVFLGCEKENSNTSLFAQSTNDTQRIIGTWSIEGGGITFTFSANGSCTASGAHLFNNFEGNYMLNNSRLILRNSGERNASIRDYYISADGRILVFQFNVRTVSSNGSLTGTSENINIWLIKQ